MKESSESPLPLTSNNRYSISLNKAVVKYALYHAVKLLIYFFLPFLEFSSD